MPLTVGGLHCICFIVHVVAATALLVVLATGEHAWSSYKRPISRSFMTPSQWHYVCWNNATREYTKVYYCEQEHKQWFVKLPESHGKFDWMFQTATAAVFFSYFSGGCHFVAMLSNRRGGGGFKGLKEVNYGTEILIRTVDYVGTAPVMLALFSVLWNANNVVGVVVSPVVLAVVIGVAFWVSYKVWEGKKSWLARWKYTWFLVLSVGFFAFLGMGTIYAVVSQSKRDGRVPRGVSQYPPGIIAASSFVLVTFSSFVYPYYLELRDGPKIKDNGQIVANLASMWAAMSLVSKIILLAAFGAGAKVQTDMLMEFNDGRDMPEPPGETPFNVDAVIVAVASAIVVLGIGFYVVARRGLRSSWEGVGLLDKRQLLLKSTEL